MNPKKELLCSLWECPPPDPQETAETWAQRRRHALERKASEQKEREEKASHVYNFKQSKDPRILGI